MWSAVDWGIVACIVAALLWRGDSWVQRSLDNRRFQLEAAEREAAVSRLERQNQAELDSRNMDELAAMRKTELLRQQAEHEAAARAIQATADDRVEEERRVIAARTEQRVLLAQQEALPPLNSEVPRLLESYDQFVQRTGSLRSFADWLGDLDIENGKVRY